MVYISPLLLALLMPFSLANQRKKMEDQIWRQAMDNLYLLPIPTSGDIITKNECSLNIALECMSQSFSNSQCFSNIYNERLLNSKNNKNDDNNKSFVLLANKESFLNYLKKCSINEVKKIDLKFTALPIITHSSGGTQENLNLVAVYPKCMTNITECFKNHQCLIPSQYNVFDKIINTCSDEAFRMLNLSFHPSKPPITTYIDDLQNLATKKIGPILDSYTTNFPPGVTDTLANLTYEELDALKMIAAVVPYLKQFLCDSEEDQRIAQNIESVTRYLFLPESPQRPEKIKNSFKTFTPEMYVAVKHMLAVEPFFRWSFCSPIFAISPSKELTNIYSPSVTLWTLQNCRGMADQNIMTRSAICEGPGLLFG